MNFIINRILLLVFLSCPLFSFGQSLIKYGDNSVAGQYIVLNGVQHYYEVYGSGMPLLLIHGNGIGIEGWASQIEYFSSNYTVYAIDNRGRGKSDLGNDSLSYIQMAKDIAEFIDKIDIDSLYVIGKSDGGIISLLLGIHHPHKIKKIVAFGTNTTPDTTALFPVIVNNIKTTRIEAENKLAKGDTTNDWRLMKEKYRMMEFQPHITPSQLASIKVPVLLISCDRDLIKLSHTLSIYNSIPYASLCILPLETHFVCSKNSKLFNEMASKFLKEEFMDESKRYEKW